MTVYVLTSHYIDVDSGDYNSEVIGVYEDIDDATKDMKQAIKDTKCDFQDEDYETSDYVDGDMSWSIWHKEYEMTYRCDIKITECEVKGAE